MERRWYKKLFRLLSLFVFNLWLFSKQTQNQVDAAKILGLFAHPSESHFAVMSSIITELARRKHNVTVFSTHPFNEPIERVQEIFVPEFPFWKNLQKISGVKQGVNELSLIPPHKMQGYLSEVGAAATENFLSSSQIKSLLQLSLQDFDYDLVIVDLFYTEALLAVGHAHNKPTIGFVSSNFNNYMQHMLEYLVPMACTPISFGAIAEFDTVLELSDYWSRVNTVRNCIERRKNFVKHHLSLQQMLVEKYFHKLYTDNKLPTMGELHAQMSILLVNSHVPLFEPRPLLLNIIPTGGLHVRPAKDLPWHIKRHLDEARLGAIYINLGNEQLCADIPQQLIEILFEVLGHRKEAVVWTCHDVLKLPNMPKNILIQHGVSQADILAHPYIKVFIMNGDLPNLQASILRHVPMLGIPYFEHEQKLMSIAQKLGVALILSPSNLTTASLKWALQTLLVDRDMPFTIRRVAAQYRDRPLGALETSMYWIEYVLRHNGGTQLKTRGVGVSSSSHLHLFDLFIYYFGMSVLIIAILVASFLMAVFVWQRKQAHKMSSKIN